MPLPLRYYLLLCKPCADELSPGKTLQLNYFPSEEIDFWTELRLASAPLPIMLRDLLPGGMSGAAQSLEEDPIDVD